MRCCPPSWPRVGGYPSAGGTRRSGSWRRQAIGGRPAEAERPGRRSAVRRPIRLRRRPPPVSPCIPPIHARRFSLEADIRIIAIASLSTVTASGEACPMSGHVGSCSVLPQCHHYENSQCPLAVGRSRHFHPPVRPSQGHSDSERSASGVRNCLEGQEQ